MKKIVLFTLFATAAASSSAFIACSSSPAGNDAGPMDSGGMDVINNTDTGTDSGIPAPPTLLTQIDRMGRPAINTALNHEFDEPDAGTAGPAKDSYNADSNIAGWKGKYAAAFEGSLAILDALDTKTVAGDGCGNQFGYDLGGVGTHYAALAGLMGDDQLYVDTSKTTCSQYLAVELNALGVLPNNDCGGRGISGSPGTAPVLGYDVMNITLQAAAGLAIATDGGLTAQEGVNDGPTTAVTAKTNGTTFPYLAQ